MSEPLPVGITGDGEIKVNKWARADAISDQIIEMINRERLKPDFSPVQLLAGLSLGFIAYLRTMPPERWPHTVKILHDAATLCVKDMTDELPDG